MTDREDFNPADMTPAEADEYFRRRPIAQPFNVETAKQMAARVRAEITPVCVDCQNVPAAIEAIFVQATVEKVGANTWVRENLGVDDNNHFICPDCREKRALLW